MDLCQISSLASERTIEQTHQIVQRINEAFENKEYYSAAFLDISQAFDRVWHTELLYKLRRFLSQNYFILLKSYLHTKHSLLKFESEYTELSSVKAHVPQGSFMMPLLYTGDLPTSTESTAATFTNTTTVLTTDCDPDIASQKLQTNQDAIKND
jgi:hypothetical protein